MEKSAKVAVGAGAHGSATAPAPARSQEAAPGHALPTVPRGKQDVRRPRGRAVQGQIARAAYNAAPHHCLHCGAAILAGPDEKLADVRKRKFCSRSCAASHNNSLAVAPKKKARPVWCTACGVQLKNPSPSQKLCPECKASRSHRLSHLPRSQSTPADMREHLKQSLASRPRVCQHCGYRHHVEATHIRPVESFPETAPLHEVNHPNNLAYFCPNCKWEFEHGLFTLGTPRAAKVRARAPAALAQAPAPGIAP